MRLRTILIVGLLFVALPFLGALVGCSPKKPPLPPVDDRTGTLNDNLRGRFESEDRLAGHLKDAGDHVANLRKELTR